MELLLRNREEPALPAGKDGTVRDFIPVQDSARVLQLWQRVFPAPTSGITPEWEFRNGPLGPQPRAVAEWCGRIVAHAGAVPIRFQYAGDTVLGAYSVAAMTDAEARGRGFYTGVAQHLYSRLEREGFAFVAGFSNRRSMKVVTGRLGRTPLRPFPWAICPAASRFPWFRRSGSVGAPGPVDVQANAPLELEEGAFGDPALDDLWRRFSPQIRIGAVRDAQFNHWRFTGHPHGVYRMRWARTGRQVPAYWVGRMFVFRRIKVAFLVDFLADPQRLEAGTLLLNDFRQWAAENGAWWLSALLPFDSVIRDLLERFGFRQVPEWLHPHRLCFSVRGLGEVGDQSEIKDPKNWFLSWADTDIV